MREEARSVAGTGASHETAVAADVTMTSQSFRLPRVLLASTGLTETRAARTRTDGC